MRACSPGRHGARARGETAMAGAMRWHRWKRRARRRVAIAAGRKRRQQSRPRREETGAAADDVPAIGMPSKVQRATANNAASLAQRGSKSREPVWGAGFVTPPEYAIVAGDASLSPHVGAWGGFDSAERRRLFAGSRDTVERVLAAPSSSACVDECDDWNPVDYQAQRWRSQGVVAVLVTAINVRRGRGTAMSSVSSTLSHRSVLGSVMGLRLSRAAIGDILIVDSQYHDGDIVDGALIFCLPQAAATIVGELFVVGRVQVSCERIELPMPLVESIMDDAGDGVPDDLQNRRLRLSSLRLDSLVAAAMNVSRGSIAAMFSTAGGSNARAKIKKNHVGVSRASTTFKRGDVLSIQKWGRLTVTHIDGGERKDGGQGFLVDVDVCR